MQWDEIYEIVLGYWKYWNFLNYWRWRDIKWMKTNMKITWAALLDRFWCFMIHFLGRFLCDFYMKIRVRINGLKKEKICFGRVFNWQPLISELKFEWELPSAWSVCSSKRWKIKISISIPKGKTLETWIW